MGAAYTWNFTVTSSSWNIRKFVGSQLRGTSYHMKTSDCYRAPSEVEDYRPSAINDEADLSSNEAPPAQPVGSPPSPPVIPSAISTPATQEAERSDQTVHCSNTPMMIQCTHLVVFFLDKTCICLNFTGVFI